MRTSDDIPRGVIVPAATPFYRQLQQLTSELRLVFFAGLPGTGKSLLSHQLAHLAVAQGRTVHLLQWDIARPVFEASAAGQRYPVRHGVTHGIIRRAVGLWARHALMQWQSQYAASQHLLIGETPFVGHRFIELARPQNDATERLLCAPVTLFVIPVPSRQVRQVITAQRQQRHAAPLHSRESEDAPPQVLHDLWQELVRIAPRLGITPAMPAASAPYDPAIYQRFYQALLRHRRTQILPVDVVLPTATFSVYDFAMEQRDVRPSAAEATHFITEVEAQYTDMAALQQDIDQWYRV